jgi:hypothetical protein
MVPTSDEAWPHELDEGEKVQLRFFDNPLLLQ